jgi:RNA polymerase sigma factor (sigma-70 family)
MNEAEADPTRKLSREEIRTIDEAVDRRRPVGTSGRVGTYLGALRGQERETPSDEQTLVRRAQAGDDDAREQLLERFLPLIVSLARTYRVEGVEFADLIQEGCVGLLRALARYDPERGTPFGAFATWWIRHALQELRSDFIRPLRLPPRALRQLAQLKSEHARIYAAERRQAPLAEIASRSGIELDQAEALLQADARPRSLEEPVAGTDDQIGHLGDLLEDPLSAQDYEDVLDTIAGEQLLALLSHLSERERDILAARLGLADRRPESLGEIGERLGVSAERVRQIEQRALAKLKQGA